MEVGLHDREVRLAMFHKPLRSLGLTRGRWPGCWPRLLALADFDNEGDLDGLALGPNGAMLVNQGGWQSGTGGVFQAADLDFGSLDGDRIAVGDLDGDADAASGVWLNQPHPVIRYAEDGNVPIDVSASDGLLAHFEDVTISSVVTTGLQRSDVFLAAHRLVILKRALPDSRSPLTT